MRLLTSSNEATEPSSTPTLLKINNLISVDLIEGQGVCTFVKNLKIHNDKCSSIGVGISNNLIKDIVKRWYDQGEHFDYDTHSSKTENEKVADFCQVLKKNN